MLILSRSEVERLLDLDELIEALAAAMSDLSAGRASSPPRVAAQVEEREAFFAAMPAYVPSSDALTSKLVSVFPQNTALRTGAGSALATRLLAREDATTLAILGTGVQARAHARTVTRVRAFTEVR